MQNGIARLFNFFVEPLRDGIDQTKIILPILNLLGLSRLGIERTNDVIIRLIIMGRDKLLRRNGRN